jgi:hypothetical protein
MFRLCSARAEKTAEGGQRRPQLSAQARRVTDNIRTAQLPTPNNFTIFQDTSEMQRVIIGRAGTGLDVR